MYNKPQQPVPLAFGQQPSAGDERLLRQTAINQYAQ